jgi:Rap1a immunity proteins
MKKMLLASALFAATAASTPAHAVFTPNTWVTACSSSDKTQQVICLTYAVGVYDTLLMVGEAEERRTVCRPVGGSLDASEIINIGINHIRKAVAEFPEMSDLMDKVPATMLIRAALMNAWPCKK